MSIYLESLCWMEFLPKFNSRGGWNKNFLTGKILRNELTGGTRLLGTKGYVFQNGLPLRVVGIYNLQESI